MERIRGGGKSRSLRSHPSWWTRNTETPRITTSDVKKARRPLMGKQKVGDLTAAVSLLTPEELSRIRGKLDEFGLVVPEEARETKGLPEAKLIEYIFTDRTQEEEGTTPSTLRELRSLTSPSAAGSDSPTLTTRRFLRKPTNKGDPASRGPPRAKMATEGLLRAMNRLDKEEAALKAREALEVAAAATANSESSEDEQETQPVPSERLNAGNEIVDLTGNQPQTSHAEFQQGSSEAHPVPDSLTCKCKDNLSSTLYSTLLVSLDKFDTTYALNWCRNAFGRDSLHLMCHAHLIQLAQSLGLKTDENDDVLVHRLKTIAVLFSLMSLRKHEGKKGWFTNEKEKTDKPLPEPAVTETATSDKAKDAPRPAVIKTVTSDKEKDIPESRTAPVETGAEEARLDALDEELLVLAAPAVESLNRTEAPVPKRTADSGSFPS
ncbi:hypothetical protein BJX96DRAFT_173827 [Aspergillus floccosus]